MSDGTYHYFGADMVGEFPLTPWYYLLLRCELNDVGVTHWVDWWLFEVPAIGEHPLFQRRGATYSPAPLDLGPVPKPERLLSEAEATAHGLVKWDGCAEATIYLHSCTRDQWVGFWKILQRVPEIAQEQFLVPRPDEAGW